MRGWEYPVTGAAVTAKPWTFEMAQQTIRQIKVFHFDIGNHADIAIDDIEKLQQFNAVISMAKLRTAW